MSKVLVDGAAVTCCQCLALLTRHM